MLDFALEGFGAWGWGSTGAGSWLGIGAEGPVLDSFCGHKAMLQYKPTP